MTHGMVWKKAPSAGINRPNATAQCLHFRPFAQGTNFKSNRPPERLHLSGCGKFNENESADWLARRYYVIIAA
jgi:hypothetical protein